MFPVQGSTFVELRLQTMGDFYEKPHFTMENYQFYQASDGVENFWTKVPKGTPLSQICSNKLFGVCGSSGV